jgi:hypothetical protein
LYISSHEGQRSDHNVQFMLVSFIVNWVFEFAHLFLCCKSKIYSRRLAKFKRIFFSLTQNSVRTRTCLNTKKIRLKIKFNWNTFAIHGHDSCLTQSPRLLRMVLADYHFWCHINVIRNASAKTRIDSNSNVRLMYI